MEDEIDENACGHAACYCLVEAVTPYCSLYCEEADEAEVIDNPCECGHPGCIPEPP